MLKQILRGVFKKYGYKFVRTEFFKDINQVEFSSISIVTENTSHKKILYIYLADEITRTHILTPENVESAIKSLQSILIDLKSENTKP